MESNIETSESIIRQFQTLLPTEDPFAKQSDLDENCSFLYGRERDSSVPLSLTAVIYHQTKSKKRNMKGWLIRFFIFNIELSFPLLVLFSALMGNFNGITDRIFAMEESRILYVTDYFPSMFVASSLILIYTIYIDYCLRGIIFSRFLIMLTQYIAEKATGLTRIKMPPMRNQVVFDSIEQIYKLHSLCWVGFIVMLGCMRSFVHLTLVPDYFNTIGGIIVITMLILSFFSVTFQFFRTLRGKKLLVHLFVGTLYLITSISGLTICLKMDNLAFESIDWPIALMPLCFTIGLSFTVVILRSIVFTIRNMGNQDKQWVRMTDLIGVILIIFHVIQLFSIFFALVFTTLKSEEILILPWWLLFGPLFILELFWATIGLSAIVLVFTCLVRVFSSRVTEFEIQEKF